MIHKIYHKTLPVKIITLLKLHVLFEFEQNIHDFFGGAFVHST